MVDSKTMYQCTVCGTERQFGCGEPDSKDTLEALNCEKCKRMTPHRFVGVKETLPTDFKIEQSAGIPTWPAPKPRRYDTHLHPTGA